MSLTGSLGGIDANRSGLVWEWLRILGELPERPMVLLIENVAGLLSTNEGANYIKLHNALLELGYKSGAMLIDAVDFVPLSRPRVFVIAVHRDISIPDDLQDTRPNWLHNKDATDLGLILPEWIWWRADKPMRRSIRLTDIVDLSVPYDKDSVIDLITPRHKAKLNGMENAIVTGYRRTQNGKQCLELRFDGLAGCLRTPGGGAVNNFLW